MADAENKRTYKRHAWRLPCSFRTSAVEQRGFLTNISARGLFIQTRWEAVADEEIFISIDNDSGQPIVVTGTVARVPRAHRSMSSLKHPGIGVRVVTAPETYYQWVLDLEEEH